MRVIDDLLREADSYLHRASRKIQHYELQEGEKLLRNAELIIRKARAEVRTERKTGGKE